MSTKMTASIDLAKLGELVRSNHPAIATGKNGKKYANIDIWLNDKEDQYGNDVSLALYDKEVKRSEYIGSGRQWKQPKAEAKQNPPAPTQSFEVDEDDLPY